MTTLSEPLLKSSLSPTKGFQGLFAYRAVVSKLSSIQTQGWKLQINETAIYSRVCQLSLTLARGQGHSRCLNQSPRKEHKNKEWQSEMDTLLTLKKKNALHIWIMKADEEKKKYICHTEKQVHEYLGEKGKRKEKRGKSSRADRQTNHKNS